MEDLEKIVDDMNKSYLYFNDQALRSGIVQSDPELAQALKGTTQTFLSLAQMAVPEPEGEIKNEMGGGRRCDRDTSSYECEEDGTRPHSPDEMVLGQTIAEEPMAFQYAGAASQAADLEFGLTPLDPFRSRLTCH